MKTFKNFRHLVMEALGTDAVPRDRKLMARHQTNDGVTKDTIEKVHTKEAFKSKDSADTSAVRLHRDSGQATNTRRMG